MNIRLDAFLSKNTIYTRTEINRFIKTKLVTVNNQVVTDKSIKINPEIDIIKLNDQIISNNKKYFVLNKPKNYVCSNNDKDGISILKLLSVQDNLKDIHVVGRLDKDTTGLVIITNDGDFTHKIKNPKNDIEKEYYVKLNENITNEQIDYLLHEEIVFDNKKIKPFKINRISDNELTITITEGKYHHIKRIFSIINRNVVELDRIRIANLKKQNLNIEEGKYKSFSYSELISLLY